jgi:hypothetical protein
LVGHKHLLPSLCIEIDITKVRLFIATQMVKNWTYGGTLDNLLETLVPVGTLADQRITVEVDEQGVEAKGCMLYLDINQCHQFNIVIM